MGLRIGKIALGMAGLLVGLLLGEGLLGWVAPQVYRRPRLWEFDPDLGWRHIPGAAGEMVTPEFELGMAINGDGLRDREYPRERIPDSWRLLAFGDSFVEGWGVPLGNSVSKRLEAELKKQSGGRQVEVVNFGVAGYGTDQELLFFEKLGRLYRPDDVLIFFYGNDLWNNGVRRGIGAERGYKPYFRLDREGQLKLAGVPVRRSPQWDSEWHARQPWQFRLERYLRRHWHLFALLRKAMVGEEVNGKQRQQFYEGLYGRDPAGAMRPLWELTGNLLNAFINRVERAGANPLVIYVPSIVQIEEEDWRTKRELFGLVGEFDLDKPNKRLAAFAEQYGFRFLDLAPVFKERAQTETLFLRDSHWNEAGHALAGERIAAFLEGERAVQEERNE
jgi:lysophospholipase L1-like esterase